MPTGSRFLACQLGPHTRTVSPGPHGEVSSYWRGCRCLPCRSAGARWKANRRLSPIARVVDAAGAKAHLDLLASQGVGKCQVATLTGIDVKVIRAIRSGRKLMARESTVSRIIACQALPADGAVTTSWWTKRYIHALRQEGYTDEQIQKWIGVWPSRVFHVERVRQGTARRAERVYREITGEVYAHRA